MVISILHKLYNKFIKLRYKVIDRPILYNVNKASEFSLMKNALLVYLIDPFIFNKNNPIFFSHQNFGQCMQIARIMGDFGYFVDVADIKHKKNIIKKEYDLLITHSMNFPKAKKVLPNVKKKIYLASGMNHIVHNMNLKKRLNNLYDRRKCLLTNLVWDDEDLSNLNNYDAIICFGNKTISDTWKINFEKKIYTFNNYGFNSLEYVNRNFLKARNNFLFFGSRQQLGKGLDLLLEIFFKYRYLNLYICSSFLDDKEFCSCYHNELFETPNIHPIGRIQVGSKTFYGLIEKCAFVILPSCSEGQPGSVINCMHAGMIPLVTTECGINTQDYGITFENDSLDEIEKTILEVSQKSENWLNTKSIKTREIARKEYSQEYFDIRWREILSEIHTK